MKIFISYSRKDAKFTDRLATDLNARGIATWQDKRDIPAGSRWDREVGQALVECSHLLVVITPDSMDSENVLDEVNEALEKNKTIFPVLYKESSINFRLKRLNYIDFRVGYDEAFGRLLNEMARQGAESVLSKNAELNTKQNNKEKDADQAISLRRESQFHEDPLFYQATNIIREGQHAKMDETLIIKLVKEIAPDYDEATIKRMIRHLE